MFLGIPLSKTHRINRYRYGFSFIEGVHSCALLSQMRVCDARRLLNKIGVVSLSDFKAIQKRTINLLK